MFRTTTTCLVLSTTHPLCPGAVHSLNRTAWEMARAKDADRRVAVSCCTGTVRTKGNRFAVGGMSGTQFDASVTLSCGCEAKVSYLVTDAGLEYEPDPTRDIILLREDIGFDHSHEPYGEAESPFFDERKPMTVH